MPTGYIYAIKSKMTDDVYIGSTTQTIANRKAKHYYEYKNPTSNISASKILQYEDAYFEIIEQIVFNEKTELTNREGFWIKTTPNCINIKIMGRTLYIYRREERTKIAQRDKIYYENNKEKIHEQTAKYREINKEKIHEQRAKKTTCICGKIITINHKARHEKTTKHLLFIFPKV